MVATGSSLAKAAVLVCSLNRWTSTLTIAAEPVMGICVPVLLQDFQDCVLRQVDYGRYLLRGHAVLAPQGLGQLYLLI